jgi:nucleotide-binding universal stress UspA family protein
MPAIKDRRDAPALPALSESRARPVILATLSVRVDPSAERMAFESAQEAGVPLVIANMLKLPAWPTTVGLGGPSAAVLPHEEDLEEVRATARRAAELGLRTELLRIFSRRPVSALLEIVSERDAGLLVLGPHLERTSPRRLRIVARRVRKGVGCLVWVAPDG